MRNGEGGRGIFDVLRLPHPVFRLSKQQRADRYLAVEPAASLVDRFADEVGGELRLEFLAFRSVRLPSVAPLGKGHRAAVEPAVDHFRHTLHSRPFSERRGIRHFVDIRLVDLQVVGQFGIGGFGLLPDLQPLHLRLGRQFFVTSDRLHLAGLLANPDRQRRAPIAFPRQGPVDVRFQEFSEAARLDVFRQPVDLTVVGQHLVFVLGGTHEPALARILNQRIFFSPPAEWIVVKILLAVEQQATVLQIADDVPCRSP